MSADSALKTATKEVLDAIDNDLDNCEYDEGFRSETTIEAIKRLDRVLTGEDEPAPVEQEQVVSREDLFNADESEEATN